MPPLRPTPELAGHGQAVGFHTGTGRLDVVPESRARHKAALERIKADRAANVNVPGG